MATGDVRPRETLGMSAGPAAVWRRRASALLHSSGGQRESEGAVVVRIGVQKNASGAKGPHFGRGRNRGTRKGMGGKTVPNLPGGPQPVAAALSEMACVATRGAGVQQL